jgi:hypothetical protein
MVKADFPAGWGLQLALDQRGSRADGYAGRAKRQTDGFTGLK